MVDELVEGIVYAEAVRLSHPQVKWSYPAKIGGAAYQYQLQYVKVTGAHPLQPIHE